MYLHAYTHACIFIHSYIYLVSVHNDAKLRSVILSNLSAHVLASVMKSAAMQSAMCQARCLPNGLALGDVLFLAPILGCINNLLLSSNLIDISLITDIGIPYNYVRKLSGRT